MREGVALSQTIWPGTVATVECGGDRVLENVVQGSGVSGFGFRVAGFGFRVSGFGFRVSGFGFRVSGEGWRVDGGG